MSSCPAEAPPGTHLSPLAAAGDASEDNDRGIAVAGSTPLVPGTAMTLAGPAAYTGDILDKPDVLWMDDQWTAEEVGLAKLL